MTPVSSLLLLSFLFLFASCSKPFPDSPNILLLFLNRFVSTNSSAQTSSGTTPSSGSSSTTTADLRKFIFLTQTTTQGNFGNVSNLDVICSSQKNAIFASLPGTGSDYRAMVVSTTRRACTTPNCTNPSENLNWVLAANTIYYRSDAAILFTTNAAGIFPFGNLQNAFTTSASDQFWTGLGSDWITTFTCNTDWISTSSLIDGASGKGGVTNSDSISVFGGNSCNSNLKFLCVRN